jgi:hypothetical protein
VREKEGGGREGEKCRIESEGRGGGGGRREEEEE